MQEAAGASDPDSGPEPCLQVRGPRRWPARRQLPETLPRETVTYVPPHDSCPAYGGTLRPLGEDVSETLEHVPARFKVIRMVRPKLSCAGCSHIVQEPAPSRPIDHCLAKPGSLAHVLVSKYADHSVPRTHRLEGRCGAVGDQRDERKRTVDELPKLYSCW